MSPKDESDLREMMRTARAMAAQSTTRCGGLSPYVNSGIAYSGNPLSSAVLQIELEHYLARRWIHDVRVRWRGYGLEYTWRVTKAGRLEYAAYCDALGRRTRTDEDWSEPVIEPEVVVEP